MDQKVVLTVLSKFNLSFLMPYSDFLSSSILYNDKSFLKLEPQEQDLLSKLLDRNIDDRPSAKSALMHPWLLGE